MRVGMMTKMDWQVDERWELPRADIVVDILTASAES